MSQAVMEISAEEQGGMGINTGSSQSASLTVFHQGIIQRQSPWR
jgi:hypothetical protein